MKGSKQGKYNKNNKDDKGNKDDKDDKDKKVVKDPRGKITSRKVTNLYMIKKQL